MKILLVPSAYVPSIGGVQLNAHELAKHLIKLGHEVIVLTSNWRQGLPFKEEIEGILVYRLPFYIYRGAIKSFIAFIVCFPVSFFGTLLLLKKFKPDVINVHFVGANAFYILLAHYINYVPLIVTFHGNEVINVPDPSLHGYTKVETEWMIWTISGILKRADYVTAVSNSLLEYAKKFNPKICENSIRIFMGGFSEKQENTGDFDDKCPFILAVGRLNYEKGFDMLIEAFRCVSEKKPSMLLKIVGDGPEKPKLLKIIEKYNLHDKVILVGALPKNMIDNYYNKCLFLVISSSWEGLPSIISEAYMYNKPVVATAVGGIPESVIDGVTGLLVELGNNQQMTDAILRLISNPNLCNKLGCNAKKLITERGDWTQIASQFCQIYQRFAQGAN